jgi:hypothetical protein
MVLSVQAMSRSYTEDSWGNHVSSVREAVKKWDSWKRTGRQPPFKENLAVETEESPLLEAVTREWLVKTQEAGKDLVCALVICKVWRLVMAL